MLIVVKLEFGYEVKTFDFEIGRFKEPSRDFTRQSLLKFSSLV